MSLQDTLNSILARIRATEGPPRLGGYNALAYNTSPSSNARGVPQQNLIQMTIGQVFDWQRNVMRRITGASTGVGAYQFESFTLRQNAQEVYGSNWRNVVFNSGTQDTLAAHLYGNAGLTPWGIGGTGGRVSMNGNGGWWSGAGGYTAGPHPGESPRDYLNRLSNSHATMTPQQRQAEQDFIGGYSVTPNLDSVLRSVDTFFTNLLNGETVGRIIIVIMGVLFIVIAVWALLRGVTNINLNGKELVSG